MKRFGTTVLLVFLCFFATLRSAAQEAKTFPLPDERYKTDILVVVAHPDDEGAATPYLARALDEHKRIAVVFGTRGSSGARRHPRDRSAERSHDAGDYQRVVSQRQGYGVAKCTAVAGKLGSRRFARATCALRSPDTSGSHPGFFAGDIYWRRPRGPSSFRRAGDGSIRSGRRSRVVPRAAGRTDQTHRTLARKSAALAAQKDSLLCGCGPRRYFSREGPGVLRERNLQIEQAAILADGARFVPRASDASQVLSR